MLLIVGCFMDTMCSIMILAPLVLPIIQSFGIDPIHFGLIMVVNLAIGFITPPLGINLFVAVGVGEASMDDVIGSYPVFIRYDYNPVDSYIYTGNYDVCAGAILLKQNKEERRF